MTETRRLHAAWPTVLAVAGLTGTFIADRVLVGNTRGVVTALGAAALATALTARLWELRTTRSRPLQLRLVWAHGGLLLAFGFYLVTQLLPPERVTLNLAAWSSCLFLACVSGVPLVLVEWAMAPVARNPVVERARADHAWGRAFGFALLVPLFGMLNYLCAESDRVWFLADGAQARPSPQTEDLVANLTEPIQVRLFYPQPSEVADRLSTYLDRLTRLNPLLEVERVDHAVDRSLSEELGVPSNGVVTVSREGLVRRLGVGQSLRQARDNLRRFDPAFLEALLYASAPRKVAYFVTGHGERPYDAETDGQGRPGVSFLAEKLRELQYIVRSLSLTGYGQRLPEDAELVMIMGPQRPFLETEQLALARGLADGGRIILALEPAQVSPAEAFLNAVGLTFDPTVYANERTNVVLTRSEIDKTALITNRYLRHPLTENLRRNKKAPFIAFGAGNVDKTFIPKGLNGKRIITGMPGTFPDQDGNFAQGGDEPSKIPTLAMSLVVTSTISPDEEGRMLVLADVDAFADELLKAVQGNLLLFRDALIWLQRSDRPFIDLPEDDDVRIIHRREEDALIFYGTTFGVPLLVLVLGWFVQRRRA
ncbi:MAG: Gldg family protein [Myxococcota bacterium]